MFSFLRRFFGFTQSPPVARSPAEAAYLMARGVPVRYPDPQVSFVWGSKHPDWPDTVKVTAPWLGKTRDYIEWDRATGECKAIMRGTVQAWAIVERDDEDRLTVADWHLYATEEAADGGIRLLSPIFIRRRLETAKVFIVVGEVGDEAVSL